MKFWIIAFCFAAMLAIFLFCLLLAWFSSGSTLPVDQWQSQSWMKPDPKLPQTQPPRLLAMTDLPSLLKEPTPKDFLDARSKSTSAGCRAAVISMSWSAMEPGPRQYDFNELKDAVEFNQGRFLYLGIQVVNTTVKDLPVDLADRKFSDPIVIQRFCELLTAMSPLLENRIRFLSIGNESDVFLGIHPDQIEPFQTFLEAVRDHAKSINSELLVGTTFTNAGAVDQRFHPVVAQMDAHFLTYYHGQHGLEGSFLPAETTSESILALVAELDQRPVLFQEIGFPSDDTLASAQQQELFVDGVFDAWEQLGNRIPLMNYFMLYDFPDHFVDQQLTYYGLTGEQENLARFLGSLGLHQASGEAKPAWLRFQTRGKELVASDEQPAGLKPTDRQESSAENSPAENTPVDRPGENATSNQ